MFLCKIGRHTWYGWAPSRRYPDIYVSTCKGCGKHGERPRKQ